MGPLMESVMETIDANYTVHRYYSSDDPVALLGSVADKVQAVVTDGGTGVSSDVLERLPNTRVVTVFGVGVDAVDLDYCREHKIQVTNTPDVLSSDVADMAVALMLAASRNLVLADAYARSGRWETEGSLPLTHRMSGKRAGIFGMGSIGLRLAKRLQAFDMEVSYCNRNKRSDVQLRYFSSIEELASEVDFLIVAASASASTNKIINAAVLEALGKDGILVNISRGSLVDQDDLVKALDAGKIRAAGLDVFEGEPAIPESLKKLDNVILQPHHASGTFETRQAMGKVVTDNLERFFDDRPLLTEYVKR